MNKASNPHLFTRDLHGLEYHKRNAGDVGQNVKRGLKAVVMFPKHLVDQVFFGQEVEFIGRSRHQKRMDHRPPGSKTYQQAQDRQADAAVVRHFAEDEDLRLFGRLGVDDPARAETLQRCADRAMNTLCDRHLIDDALLFKFQHGGIDGRGYVELPIDLRYERLPVDADLRAVCLRAIADEIADEIAHAQAGH
jgi:hypothetical protein